MTYDEYVAAIAREGRALGVAAGAAGLDAPVPPCEGWDVAELLSHQGRLHRWVLSIVECAGAQPPTYWSDLDAPARTARPAWFAEGVDLLVDAFSRVDAAAPAWSWTPEPTAGFWARRMAHETAMHRRDAQCALGSPAPFAVDLALDGIQEVFDVLPYRRRADRVRGNGETIHLHCTDAPGEWLVHIGPDGVTATRGHAKADVAARASASDLLLLLWNRITPNAVEVIGDRAVLDLWQELAQF